jgi:hypothetical protein
MSVDPQTLVEMQDRFDEIIETGEWAALPPCGAENCEGCEVEDEEGYLLRYPGEDEAVEYAHDEDNYNDGEREDA